MFAKLGPLEEKDYKPQASVEMLFFRRTARYILFDNRRSEEILEELEIEPVDEKLRMYNSHWLRQVKE